MAEITAILAKPSEHGFEFVTAVVKKYGRTSGPVPLIKVTDVAKFEKAFPGVILRTSNGSSVKVTSQGIVRNAWFDSNDHVQLSLQTRLINWLLGIEQVQLKYV